MVLDPDIGARMNSIFLDDLAYAEEVTSTGFRERSWLQRLAERGANLIIRVL